MDKHANNREAQEYLTSKTENNYYDSTTCADLTKVKKIQFWLSHTIFPNLTIFLAFL